MRGEIAEVRSSTARNSKSSSLVINWPSTWPHSDGRYIWILNDLVDCCHRSYRFSSSSQFLQLFNRWLSLYRRYNRFYHRFILRYRPFLLFYRIDFINDLFNFIIDLFDLITDLFDFIIEYFDVIIDLLLISISFSGFIVRVTAEDASVFPYHQQEISRRYDDHCSAAYLHFRGTSRLQIYQWRHRWVTVVCYLLRVSDRFIRGS